MHGRTIARVGLATLLAATVVVTAPVVPADACTLAPMELESNPIEGPRGTQVTVSAPFWYVVGPDFGADCSGLEYPATVDIVWTQGGQSVTVADDVPTSEQSGGFSTTIVVPASAAFGPAAISVVPLPFEGCEICVATFTVTDPNASPDTVEPPPEIAPRVTPRFTG